MEVPLPVPHDWRQGKGRDTHRERVLWLLSLPTHPTSPPVPANAQTQPGTTGQERLGKSFPAVQSRAEEGQDRIQGPMDPKPAQDFTH